jgi:dephospho-CoA kinase
VNYLVGLTGGIGSGKSTVAGLFAALGARIIDTDAISHALTGPGGAAIPAIREKFGNASLVADGSMDRNKMREAIFADASARQRLESILHPLILQQARHLAAQATDAPYTLVVVPLLFEGGRYADWLHRVITVDCPEQQQVARTMKRSGLNESDIRSIMARQHSRAERQRLADDTIRNDGSLERLKAQVEAMHRRLSLLASESN